MNLLQHIRSEKTQQKKKRPFERNVFNKISGLVRWYELDDGILKRLDKAVDYLPKKKSVSGRLRPKIPFEFPLFSLATKEEYSLAEAIIQKIDNPYLQFAKSPEEILLCRPLYDLNPALSQEQLTQYPFETLFLHERVQADNMKTAQLKSKNNG